MLFSWEEMQYRLIIIDLELADEISREYDVSRRYL